MRRIAVLFGVIVLLLLVQCAGESGDNVPAGPRIMYKVTYADGRPGEVHVKYFSPGANRILEEDVDTPWTSEIFHASRGTVLRVEVVGMRSFPGNVQCNILTDEGPYGKELGASSLNSPCVVTWKVGEVFTPSTS